MATTRNRTAYRTARRQALHMMRVWRRDTPADDAAESTVIVWRAWGKEARAAICKAWAMR